MTEKPILVLGGTGYVGGRLVPLLLSSGYTVRVAGRSAEKIHARTWGDHPNLQIAVVDIHDMDALIKAARGCGVIYYLVHSVSIKDRDYGARDRAGAYNLVQATRATPGLERIIYLGSLGGANDHMSREILCRQEIARILTFASVPVTTLRAGLIIGSGSAAFEMISYMAERHPLMLAPTWMTMRCQPISIRNVLVYLLECLEHGETIGREYDIGGNEVMTYSDLFQLYAKSVGLRRRKFIPLPFIMPRLSAYWVSLVTPIPYNVSRVMVESLLGEMVCQEDYIREVIPQKLVEAGEAITMARQSEGQGNIESSCFDSGFCDAPEWIQKGDAEFASEGGFKAFYSITLKTDPATVWDRIKRLGGEQGWYYGNTLWRIRGLIDKIFGGVGLSRGRRDKNNIRVGDALDFWRVLTVKEPEQLQLVAEMLVWGQALLQFDITETAPGQTELFLKAYFRPKGLCGLLYWYSVYPFHAPIFRGMLKKMAKSCGAKIISGPEAH